MTTRPPIARVIEQQIASALHRADLFSEACAAARRRDDKAFWAAVARFEQSQSETEQ